jgi:hypothetical protein
MARFMDGQMINKIFGNVFVSSYVALTCDGFDIIDN